MLRIDWRENDAVESASRRQVGQDLADGNFFVWEKDVDGQTLRSDAALDPLGVLPQRSCFGSDDDFDFIGHVHSTGFRTWPTTTADGKCKFFRKLKLSDGRLKMFVTRNCLCGHLAEE